MAGLLGFFGLVVTVWAIYGLIKPGKALWFWEGKESRLLVIGLWFGAMMLIGALSPERGGASDQAAAQKQSREATPSKPKKPDLELLSHSVSEGQFGNRVITGEIRNNTNKSCGYTHVTFNLYDGNGNRVGSALANIANLGSSETWRFEAMILQDATICERRPIGIIKRPSEPVKAGFLQRK